MTRIIKPDTQFLANVRDLGGGYETPAGPTITHRFLRSGNTSSITRSDISALEAWGVRRVLDLRSWGESPRQTCRLAYQSDMAWENVPLFDIDISAAPLKPGTKTDNYLVTSYLSMLASSAAIRRIFSFFSGASKDECTLFHCAAGMDRTGMCAMMLLGLAGVSREQIIADYCYSFAMPQVVDAAVRRSIDPSTPKANPRKNFAEYLLSTRLEAITVVYDTVISAHGTMRNFLVSSGVSDIMLDVVYAHLIKP